MNMPKYDYSCSVCGVFEVFQSMFDDTLTTCPDCGAGVKKIISAPRINGGTPIPATVAPTYRPERSALWNSAQQE